MSERSFDVVVLGSGTAGREGAARLAQAGLSVDESVSLGKAFAAPINALVQS
jgi:pyruvate/2-oxoglutarate dehydrogenase complex dihydrolipoamide dehydrogenase (E3) component